MGFSQAFKIWVGYVSRISVNFKKTIQKRYRIIIIILDIYFEILKQRPKSNITRATVAIINNSNLMEIALLLTTNTS